jgi:SAM-dependent methyltransferase
LPPVRRLRDRADGLLQETERLRRQLADAGKAESPAPTAEYVNTDGAVLQYRIAYYEAHGHVPPGAGLPSARAYPAPGAGLSYKQKLTGLLPTATGLGAEIGPLNIPLLSRDEARILYVDHLDTAGLRAKYPTLGDIAEIDRPMVNDSLADTLSADAPLDYVVGSQVFEHVPNPIRWLHEIAAILRPGGLLALSLPDRRLTFDLLRQETRPADIIAAYIDDHTIPGIRSVYDNHALASFINMHWATSESVYPDDVINGRGAVNPKRATDQALQMVQLAKAGQYLDVHAWVYTPVSFLLTMAQLAAEGLIPFSCRQFYPTDATSPDRGSSSFTIILEKPEAGVPAAVLRKTFLLPLGEPG